MMDPHLGIQHASDEHESPAAVKKIKRLSNGTNEQEHPELKSDGKLLSGNAMENGMTCNGTSELEGGHSSDTGSEKNGVGDNQQDYAVSHNTESMEDDDIIECAGNNSATTKGTGENALKPDSDNDKGDNLSSSITNVNCDHNCKDSDDGDAPENCDMEENIPGALSNSKSSQDGEEENNIECEVPDKELSTQNDIEMDTESICVISSVTSGDVKFDEGEVPEVEHVSSGRKDQKSNLGRGLRKSSRKDKEDIDNDVGRLSKTKEVTGKGGKKSLSKNKDVIESEELHHSNKDKEAIDAKYPQNSSKNKKAADSEKENIDNDDVIICQGTSDNEGKIPRKNSPEQQNDKQGNNADVAADDIEIIGESKVVNVNTPKSLSQTSQNIVFVPSGLPGQLSSSQGPTTANINPLASPAMLHGPGFAGHGMSTLPSGFAFPGGTPGHGPQNASLLVPTVAPPKPKSSLDQIELIRWEIQNRINTRPKYFKPNSASELGPLAKFLFDIGSDLIKESVYHDLVKIQSKKKGDDKLSIKEKEDLEKLKEIEKDLYATIGHLKLKLKQKCKICHFQTESNNVLYHHKQYPHEDNKFLRCAHCSFSTKQAITFKFHMESEHGMQPKLHDKKAFYECDLCPYENNQEQKLTLHKQRCIKQFRPLFNLHPSCLSGAEINLCLENIFYRPIVPKNLKFLQQKHAQQQAALAEARRQQAQIQALAAQKNAAAVAAKKQQQSLQKRMPATIVPRANTPSSTAKMPVTPKIPGQAPVRYNAASNPKGPCPTVATMLNAKQNSAATPPGLAGTTAAGGFEVCEICGGYVKDRKALRIHFFYAHRIDLPFNLFERNQAPLYCATCYVRFWTAHGLRKHIDTHKEENQTRGVVGKCISCSHHVLNLLLHMRVVHNREMQHYINALMCMFCGSHFGSQQECERHILKVHGHIDPVTGTLKSTPNAPTPRQPQKATPVAKKQGNNNLVKGSVCVLCNLNFGRNVDLTRHCMRMHHTCMKCGMVVIDKASLMKHTCLSSPSGTRDCTMCGESGFHPAYYVKHLRDKHLKRFSIRVKKLDKKSVEQWTKRPYPFDEPDLLVEISDSDEDSALSKLKPLPSTIAGKRPRIGPACKIGRRPENPVPVDTPAPEEEVVVDDKDEVEDTEDSVKEAVATSKEVSSADEEDTTGESSLGQKRKSDVESPDADRASKRKK